MSEASDAAAAAESRKSRLQILRERQKKLRESYKVQIDMSRRTLNEEDGGRISPMPAVSETATPAAPATEAPKEAKETAPKPVATAAVPVTPSTEKATTDISAQVLVQTENEELKREIVALKAERELLLERQMKRFESASEQLNEMEILLEDYRSIAEESEENNAVLKAQISLMKSEEASWKKEETILREQVIRQQERLDSSVQAMNDMEKSLNKAQDDLQMSDQHVMNLEHQLRSFSNNPMFQGQVHSGTTYYPQQQAVFYPMHGGDGKGGVPPGSAAGRGNNRSKKPLFGGGGPGMPPQRRGSYNGPPPQQRRGSNKGRGGGPPNFHPNNGGGGGGGPPNFGGGGGAPNFNASAPSFAPPQGQNPDNFGQPGNKKKRR